MKELSIEQKAKRYDEALKYAMIYYKNGNEDMKMMIKTCFPVLTEESEDENKLKYSLMQYLWDMWHKDFCPPKPNIELCDKWIAWLEKQGEKPQSKSALEAIKEEKVDNQNCAKPDDKVEPKFKVGDYIERKDGLGCHAKIIFVGGNVYGCEKLIYQENEFPFFEFMFKNQDEFQISSDFKQNPTDKSKPKFKVGEWITNGEYTWYIKKVGDCFYDLKSLDGRIVDDTISYVDERFHLWTIQDAKAGDVLAFDNETIVIFKDLYNSSSFHSYCHIEDRIFDISKDELPDWWESGGFHPATKEQRDLLFQKMHEAGYEWDDEKKEPKKIEQKPAWSEEDASLCVKIQGILSVCKSHSLLSPDLCKEMCDWLKFLKDRVQPQPKQEWSEEDNLNLQCCIAKVQRDINNGWIGTNRELLTWLKSLKERVGYEANCTTTKEWNEEDKKMFVNIKACLRNADKDYSAELNWLKSIRPQNRWKPSEEQLKSLEEVIDTGYFTSYPFALETLFKDLKKLMEE